MPALDRPQDSNYYLVITQDNADSYILTNPDTAAPLIGDLDQMVAFAKILFDGLAPAPTQIHINNRGNVYRRIS